MGGDIEFNIGEMREHTGRLQGLAERAQTASDTADQLKVDGLGLYGVFCSPVIVPPLAITEQAMLGSMTGLADTMTGRTSAMAQTANAYEGTEEMATEIAEDAIKAVE